MSIELAATDLVGKVVDAEALLAALAVVLAVSSLLVSLQTRAQERKTTAIASSFSLMVGAEQMLADHPTALRFHGIEPDDLRAAGIEPEEFAYLVANFSAAGVLYRINEPTNDDPFPEDSYRYVMLEAEITQKAWPFLRKLINPQIGLYGKRIEKTLEIIRKKKSRKE